MTKPKLIPYAGKPKPHSNGGRKAQRHEFRGQSLTVAEITMLTGLTRNTVSWRIKRGTLTKLDKEASS